MSDGQRSPFRYGIPNGEMLRGWLRLAAEDDGPFWALNLMRYRELADYADGRESTLTGREADDAYAPLGPLEAIGAVPVFLGDVADQAAGWTVLGSCVTRRGRRSLRCSSVRTSGSCMSTRMPGWSSRS
jgi:hypothetical protein